MSDLPSPFDPTKDAAALDSLDRLVAEAYRLPTDELRVARLERLWRRERQSMRRRGWAKSFAAAASIAIMGGIVWGLTDQPAKVRIAKVPLAPQPPGADPAQEPELVAAEAPHDVVAIVGQPPDRLREVLFTVRTQKRSSRLVSLAELLAERESLPPAVARQEILAATGWRSAEFVQQVEREIVKLPAASQRLAISLVAGQENEAAIGALQRLAKHSDLRPICLEHLFTLTDGKRPAVLLEAAQCNAVAMWLLEGAAGDPRRVECYLALVSHPSTRGEALSALRGLAQPPVSSLVAAIDSDERQVRFAAALALGQLGGAEVAQPLIELVTGHNRRNAEAWLAIVACNSPLAEEFLAHAARDPLLLGHYNAARLRQQHLTP